MRPIILELLEDLLVSEMKEVYGDIWQRIIKIKPRDIKPGWSMQGLFSCYEKHHVAVFSMNFPKSFKAAVDNIRNHLSTNDVTRRRSEVGHRSNDLLNLENWARTLARIILDRKNTKVGKIAAQRCLDQLDSLNDPPLRCLDQLDSLNNPPDKPGNHFHHPHQSLSDDDDIMTNQELPKDDDIMTNQELPKDDDIMTNQELPKDYDRVKDDPQLDADEDADMSSQPKPLGNLQANQIILQFR